MDTGIRVVALVRRDEERQAVRAAAGSRPVSFCASVTDVVARAAKAPSIVVWGLSSCGELKVAGTAETLGGLRTVHAVVIRVDLTRAAARQVLAVANVIPSARISICGHDDLSFEVAESAERSDPVSSCAAIALHVLPHIPENAADVVAGALVASHRRTTVTQLAAICRMPRRTAEWTLQRARLAPARRLLGYFLALHSLWRLDVQQWSGKRAALVAGFGSRQAWAAYILRHAGASPTRLLRVGGFSVLLDRWRTQLQWGSHPG